MKRKTFLAGLLLAAAGLQTVWAQKVVLNFANGEREKYEVWQLDSISFEEAGFDDSGIIDGREFIDLGLPSGTLWATTNVGADTPEGIGWYLSWGETTQHKNYYNWDSYDLCARYQYALTKYCTLSSYGYNGFVDNKTELEAEDDAATVNWGSNWQTPSYGQIGELVDTAYTEMKRVKQEGVMGYLITSKINGNSIFMPITGKYEGNTLTLSSTLAGYWSRTLGNVPPVAYYLHIIASHPRIETTSRCFGMPVRPVRYQPMSYFWPVRSISFLTKTHTIALGKSLIFSVRVLPEYASNSELTWESSDESIVTMSGKKATGVSLGTCTITCRTIDGSGVYAQFEVTVEREGVDLGLPSGTLWASMNVGANAPEEYGDYFAWGETEPKDNYIWGTYKFYGDDVYEDMGEQFEPMYLYSTVTKYCTNSQYGYQGKTDNLTELLPEDDAATANWGEDWQMPSIEQLAELRNPELTTLSWVTQNGVAGVMISSNINGNSIFVPASGNRDGSDVYLTGRLCDLWSRDVTTNENTWAGSAYFNSDRSMTTASERFRGICVRPVKKASGVTSIVLSETQLNLEVSESKTVTATIVPADAVNPHVKWESSNMDVVQVQYSEAWDNECTLTASSPGTCTITCSSVDNATVYAQCQVTVDYGYVDLDLPSGTLWAKYNIHDSDYPDSDPYYYPWGDQYYRLNNTLENYLFFEGTEESGILVTKYCMDNWQSASGVADQLKELEPEDDVATVYWGDNWEMPSNKQFMELYHSDNTTWTWTTQKGRNGMLITSKRNGNSIFLPAAGYHEGERVLKSNEMGCYWSRMLNTNNSIDAQFLIFDESGFAMSVYPRYYGMSVRAVRRQ